MYQLAKPLFLYCETPLHAGSGSELGIIDLPIQRERHTGFPKIEGSSLKGALRERFEQVHSNGDNNNRNNNNILLTFGPEDDGSLHAGAIGVTDARLLLFPVKSMRGVFAWVTCPDIINRFIADLRQTEGTSMEFTLVKENTRSGDGLLIQVGNNSIVLEEYTFDCKLDENTQKLASWIAEAIFKDDNGWSEKLKANLVVLPNDDFKDFVHLSTEVITRTKIDNETGTVESGALFTEEYLPSESVMYSLVLTSPVFSGNNADKPNKLTGKYSESKAENVLSFVSDTIKEKFNNRMQIGGNATLGKGLIRTTLLTN